MSTDVALADQPEHLAMVSAMLGAGAIDPGCKGGPAAFRRSSEFLRLEKAGLNIDWHDTPAGLTEPGVQAEDRVADVAEWIATAVEGLVAAHRRFVVLGGDHSCATGTWAGAARALRPRRIGLIWIDAHMDMHRPETTYSGAINGMPVACLLGHGFPRLAGIAGVMPAVAPGNVCLVGVHSFEPEEEAFASELGVRVFHMAEVRDRGLATVLEEARRIATDGTAGYGVSLDLDAIDPRDAPGVGTPEPGGIAAAALLEAWRDIVCHAACLGIEIAELNPLRDEGRKTVQLVGALIAKAFAGQREKTP